MEQEKFETIYKILASRLMDKKDDFDDIVNDVVDISNGKIPIKKYVDCNVKYDVSYDFLVQKLELVIEEINAIGMMQNLMINGLKPHLKLTKILER